MNLPSLDKYENAVKSGGTIYIDSSLISRRIARTDVTAVYIPATQLAWDSGVAKLANMVILGKLISGEEEALTEILTHAIDSKRKEMLELNLKALLIGRNTQC